jgi:two-component system sensor histidine kinase UhpB
LDELQRLIADLRPSHLDDLGLGAALRWYAAEVQKRAPLEINVQVDGDRRDLPAEVNTTLFRVAQEALTNTVKHAHASYAEVRLSFEASVVRLSVLDNGRGFDSDKVQASRDQHWGLLGMRERASLLGGNFSIDSRRGRGTTVEVTIPYDQQLRMDGNEDTLASGG